MVARATSILDSFGHYCPNLLPSSVGFARSPLPPLRFRLEHRQSLSRHSRGLALTEVAALQVEGDDEVDGGAVAVPFPGQGKRGTWGSSLYPAFARARGIFLLGCLEAFGLGMIITSFLGRFMVSRNWSPDGSEIPVEALRGGLEPLLGQLPRVIGVDPFYVLPSAVVMMTFLSFFIGIFLQLMWEELPITEPL